MKSFIAALRSLVLPFGAVSGARIILDGVNGKIQIYNASNVLVANLDSNGLVIQNTVFVDTNGVKVVGSVYTYIIDRTSGFIAKFTADTGAYANLFPAVLFLESNNPSTVNGNAIGPGQMLVDTDHAGAVDTPRLTIFTPTVNAKTFGSVSLYGEDSASGLQPHMKLSTNLYLQSGFVDEVGHEYVRGENRRFTVSFSGLNSFNLAGILFTVPFAIAPIVVCNIEYGAGVSSRWGARALNVSTTGFTLNLAYMSDSTTTFTWTNGTVTFVATEPT